ncbi:MAG: hypothetical protein AAFZ65_11485 [Planctomycetota bacterium]
MRSLAGLQGVAVLVALMGSWLAGGLHLALEHTPGGGCHAGGCAHAALDPSADATDVETAEAAGTASVVTAEADQTAPQADFDLEAGGEAHECAVPQLLSEGTSHVPGQTARVGIASAPGCLRSLAWRAPPQERIPRFLIAPKNSPPARAARVLA